jgi:iron complex transport system ATP-binding protein
MMIELRELAVGYGRKEVLAGITACIGRGQFVTLLGPNGAGKTTLLRTLSRHLKSLRGTIVVDHKTIESYTPKEFAARLAVVLTTRPDTELFTGFQFAAMGRHPHTGLLGVRTDGDKEKVWEALELVRATDLADRPMNELSDGERQKLFIARALAQEPRIILLDEPTSHLDLKNKMEIMELLHASCRKKGSRSSPPSTMWALRPGYQTKWHSSRTGPWWPGDILRRYCMGRMWQKSMIFPHRHMIAL